ncbi:magnesium transporter [Rhodobacteraceae bacterium F11138]|nr:magnesium transporter [Rhodobacteraceae bacterium F11138]
MFRETFAQQTSTAMDIANPSPVLIETGSTCADAAEQIATAHTQSAQSVCVVDGARRPLGIVGLRDCLRAAPETEVDDIMSPVDLIASNEWTAEESSRQVLNDDPPILPVLDAQGAVLGVISPQRAYRHLLGKAEEGVNDFAGLVGTPEDDYGQMSIWADFRRRAPWVLVLAVAGLAAGYVVHVYEDALDALVILALYMPMVADTGGNVGTQSASLVTRAISSGNIRLRDALMVLWRETRVSLMMAAALFLFAYLKVLLISNPADVPMGLTLGDIAFAIGVALAVQVISATLIGAVLPLGATAARLDPAVVSGPALTTIVDLSGLVLYFGITTHMLGLGTIG